jgi:hypothetical protein
MPFSETWNGRSWKTESVLIPKGIEPDIDFSGLSCPSDSECLAVGSDSGATLAEKWNGRSWQILGTPDPASAALLSGKGS